MMAAEKLQAHVKHLADLLDQPLDAAVANLAITGLRLDSRKIQSGDAFVALQGELQHGLEYVPAAIERGAVAVIYDVADSDMYTEQLAEASAGIACIGVANLSQKLGELANRFYDAPSSQMFTVGVTGTDGKTSSTHFIRQLLTDTEQACGVVGTLGYGSQQLTSAEGTTPDVFSLHAMLADMLATGVHQVAMEVSSHGIAQDRIQGVSFDVAALTNIGRDHLDYHQTLEAYRAVKQSFLTNAAHSVMVLNLDDETGLALAQRYATSRRVYGYSLTGRRLADVECITASAIQQTETGLVFTLEQGGKNAAVYLPLFGLFNIANVLLGVCVLLARGMGFDECVKRLENIHNVPGRMERLDDTADRAVVIDYAHTPQALEHSLQSLRQHFAGKILCVFGCGGDRDRGKRPLMAASAERNSDFVIVTSDNPRHENLELILRDVEAGFTHDLNHITVEDRKQAIHQALELAKPGDVVLVAGKGHETYQLVGDRKIPFDDAEVVKAFLGGGR